MSNKKIKKGFQTFRSTVLPAYYSQFLEKYYSQVLEKWTKLVKLEKGHGVEQLISTKTGRPEYRMEINDKLVSLEMLSSNDQGHNSFVYLVKTHGFTNEAILKQFMTDEEETTDEEATIESNSIESKSSEPRQHTYRTEPKLEARLQKYAHVHDLAPAVFASNDVAMISEKCKAIVFKIPKCSNRKRFGRRLRVGPVLQEWFNKNTEKILTLIDTMYQDIGMYNTDPNEGNYMLNQSDKLIQIDYGGNRFDKKKSFDTFADGFVQGKSNRMYLSCQKQLLLEDQPTYPPYFYWFSRKLVGTTIQELLELPTIDKLKAMGKSQWDELFVKLRTRRDENCNKIKALEENINPQGQTTLFVQHIVRKF
jgi:hypothetical protein